MTRLIEMTDQRFGKWIVLKRAPNYRNGKARWFCRCDCGKEQIVQSGDLRNGHSKGCRICQINRRNTKHGKKGTRLYHIWRNMIQRCENPNHKAYKDYGGRGIRVYPEWRKDFMVFQRWALKNGYKEDLTIDRIDNDGNYETGNCQFITKSENSLKAWHTDKVHEEKSLKEPQIQKGIPPVKTGNFDSLFENEGLRKSEYGKHRYCWPSIAVELIKAHVIVISWETEKGYITRHRMHRGKTETDDDFYQRALQEFNKKLPLARKRSGDNGNNQAG